jgi:hypothetical protein
MNWDEQGVKVKYVSCGGLSFSPILLLSHSKNLFCVGPHHHHHHW